MGADSPRKKMWHATCAGCAASGVLTLAVAIMAAATATARSFVYFVDSVRRFVLLSPAGNGWNGGVRNVCWRPRLKPDRKVAGETAKDVTFHCSFCGKSQADVTHLISSPQDTGAAPAHICDKCVEVCNSILADLRRQNQSLARCLLACCVSPEHH